MARLSLNKSTLSEQIKELKTYRNFLPSLDLKRRQLLSEQEKARKELRELDDRVVHVRKLVEEPDREVGDDQRDRDDRESPRRDVVLDGEH